jgi:biopolymer transport protein ExbD
MKRIEEPDVEINVLPVANAIFCLLIFFMSSFQFKTLEGKIESWLPKDEGIGMGTGRSNPMVDKIRMVLKWDRITLSTARSFGGKVYTSEQDELLITTIKQSYLMAKGMAKGGEDIPIVIEADPLVPWQEVVTLMDLCKRENMNRLELAATITGE